MSAKLRAGIIGLSWIGSDPAGPATHPVLGTAPPYSHASAMAGAGNIDVVAACDVQETARSAFADRWGSVWPDAKLYEDGHELLAAGSLDLVAVVTPDHLHAEYVLAAVKAGVSMVFCEKPLTTSIDDADEMMREINRAGTTVTVNHTQRWRPEHVAARERVGQEDLGPVSQVIITAGGPRAMLFRNLSHQLDLANYLIDDQPVWVSAELEAGSENYGLRYAGDGGRDPAQDPGANIFIGYRGGARAFIAGMKSGPPAGSIDVLCEGGSIAIDPLGARVVTMPRTNDGTPGSVSGPTITGLRAASTVTGMQAGLQDLIDAHREGREPTSSAASAYRTVALLDGVLRSQASGNVRVEVRQFTAEGSDGTR